MKCPKCGSRMIEVRLWHDDGFCTIIWTCENCSYTERLVDVILE